MRKHRFDGLFTYDEVGCLWVKASEIVDSLHTLLYHGLRTGTFKHSGDVLFITADDAIDLLLKHAEEHSDEETRTLDSIKIAIIVREQRKGKIK